MKKIIIAALILLSCTKEISKPQRPETVALDKPPVITFTEPYDRYDFEGGVSFLIKQTPALNSSKITMYDLERKFSYFSFTVTNTGFTNFVEPVLPPGTDDSWSKCMLRSIRICGATVLCSQACKNEWMIGCMSAWGIACIGKASGHVSVYPKITRVYLGPVIQ